MDYDDYIIQIPTCIINPLVRVKDNHPINLLTIWVYQITLPKKRVVQYDTRYGIYLTVTCIHKEPCGEDFVKT